MYFINGNSLTTDYFKEMIGKKIALFVMHTEERKYLEMLDVEAVLLKTNGIKKRIGFASMGIKGNEKRAELLDILVEFYYYRHKGIGSKMLRLMEDFYKDNKAQEFFGNINAAKIKKKAIYFYKKNGYDIIEEKSPEGDTIWIQKFIKKPQNPQFSRLHKIEPLTNIEWNSVKIK